MSENEQGEQIFATIFHFKRYRFAIEEGLIAAARRKIGPKHNIEIRVSLPSIDHRQFQYVGWYYSPEMDELPTGDVRYLPPEWIAKDGYYLTGRFTT